VSVLVAGYLFQTLLLIFAEKVTLRIKREYLRSVLLQDEQWFDEHDPAEMANQLDKDCDAIKAALGDKPGNLLFSFSWCVTGLGIGAIFGWMYSLSMLVLAPTIILSVFMFSKGKGIESANKTKAYAKCDGMAN